MDVLTQLRSTLSDRYTIEREIGAGGMATVYLARDVRHDRHVALKVLNPELGAVLGVDRFLAEIKTTANLQHPNLLPLFDSGEAGGLLFYVMPFVEGESLRARLDREKQLPVDEAVRIAVAVANALDYAHGHGVIHRDLKPENILLQAGQPVVADFGIALAVSNAGGTRVTQTGLSLGTPQYMSPEQATGDRAIDGRTDIYSLGAVLFEMLTGEPPHIGQTAQAIIARVLTDTPRSVRGVRSTVPDAVDAAVARSLQKLPADRFATAREFAEAVSGRMVAMPSGPATTATAVVPPRAMSSRLRDPVVIGLAAVALASAGVAAFMASRQPSEDPLPTFRFVLAASDASRPLDNFPWPAAISPDGRHVVYSARGSSQPQLFLLRTDQLEARPIPGTEDGYEPLFSPDGQWIAFQVRGQERKVRLDGSAPVNITEGGAANGADWTTRNELVIGAQGSAHGLTRVNVNGGDKIVLTKVDSAAGEREHVWPIAAPDGKSIVFTIWKGTLESSRLAITNIDDGRVVPLNLRGIRPLAILEGHVVYVQADGAVMAAPLDVAGQRVTGDPVAVHDPVPVAGANNGNSGVFISHGGAIVTSRGGASSRMDWIGPNGQLTPAAPDVKSFSGPRLSPDGRRIAVVVSEQHRNDVWIYDLATRTPSSLTTSGTVISVDWIDDRYVVYMAGSGGVARTAIWKQDAAGGSAPEKLAESVQLATDATVSPDGRSLLIRAYNETTWDLFRVALDSPSVLQPWVATGASYEAEPRFSPDGKWVSMTSDESGRNEIYIRSYPDPSVRVPVSAGGGSESAWSNDGRAVWYRAGGGTLMKATLTYTPAPQVVARDTVFRGLEFQQGTLSTSYDASRDGSRIVALITDRDNFQLVVSPNWREELRARLAAAQR